MLLKSSKICESNFRRKRRKRRQAEKQSSLFFVKVRLSEHVALTIVSLFRPHFVRPYESLRRRKPTSYNARRCLAHLSVAFSSFAKTKFCRVSIKRPPCHFKDFYQRFFNSSFFKGTRSCSATQNAMHFALNFIRLKKFTETCFGESEKTNR